MIRLLGTGWAAEAAFLLLMLFSVLFGYWSYQHGRGDRPPDKDSPGCATFLVLYALLALSVVLLVRGAASYF